MKYKITNEQKQNTAGNRSVIFLMSGIFMFGIFSAFCVYVNYMKYVACFTTNLQLQLTCHVVSEKLRNMNLWRKGAGLFPADIPNTLIMVYIYMSIGRPSPSSWICLRHEWHPMYDVASNVSAVQFVSNCMSIAFYCWCDQTWPSMTIAANLSRRWIFNLRLPPPRRKLLWQRLRAPCPAGCMLTSRLTSVVSTMRAVAFLPETWHLSLDTSSWRKHKTL